MNWLVMSGITIIIILFVRNSEDCFPTSFDDVFHSSQAAWCKKQALAKNERLQETSSYRKQALKVLQLI